jgi:hypothetical protein
MTKNAALSMAIRTMKKIIEYYGWDEKHIFNEKDIRLWNKYKDAIKILEGLKDRDQSALSSK